MRRRRQGPIRPTLTMGVEGTCEEANDESVSPEEFRGQVLLGADALRDAKGKAQDSYEPPQSDEMTHRRPYLPGPDITKPSPGEEGGRETVSAGGVFTIMGAPPPA